MSTPRSLAVDRLLPRSTLLQVDRLALSLWSAIAALCLAALLVDGMLLIDLLATQGKLLLAPDEIPVMQQRAGDMPPVGLPADKAAANDVLLRDVGILPTAWALGDRLPFRWLQPLYRRTSLVRHNREAAATLLVVGILLSLLRLWATLRLRAHAWKLAVGTASSLRGSIHRQAMRLGVSDLEGDEPQAALDLFVGDVDRIRERLYRWLVAIPRDPVLLVLMVALALAADWRLAVQCLVPVLAVWWFIVYERSRGAAARELADARAEVDLRLLAESFRKTRLVQGYGMDAFEQNRFASQLTQFTDDTTTGRKRASRLVGLARAAAVIGVAIALYFASMRVVSEVDPLPLSLVLLLAGVFAVLTLLAGSLRSLTGVWQTLAVDADRIHRYLAQIPEVGQAVGAKFLEPLAKSIIFESVTYRRGGRTILKDFDLRLPAGGSTALISLDPLEPRTVAYLLPRFVEPQAGRILFDSEDTAWGTLESLRAEAVYVGGADPFFTGSVAENITCGESKYSVQDATEAAKTVHAHNFVSKLPQGYETLLGERGEQLSPDQAFRLGLARAALRNPALMIVEEPAVPLDDDAKSLIDDAYQRLMRGRTILFLPSRLSTVRKCDRVVLLRNGKVEAIGTHAELVSHCEFYRHWEYLTFNAFRRGSAT